MICLILLVVARNEHAFEVSPVIKNSSTPRKVRLVESYDDRLDATVKRLRAITRKPYSVEAPYALTPNEIERFLKVRGKTAASLSFVVMCKGGDAFLQELAKLPDSPLKFLVLFSHSSGKEELTYVRKLCEQDPENKIAHLALAEALRKLGQVEECSKALGVAETCRKTEAYRGQILEESRQANLILGEDRGLQMLELHGTDSPILMSRSLASLFLDTLDPDRLVKTGETGVNDLIAKIDKFHADIGLPVRYQREAGYMRVRDYLMYWRSQSGNHGFDQEIKNLNQELDSEFLAGLKEELSFQEMDDKGRKEYLKNMYYGN